MIEKGFGSRFINIWAETESRLSAMPTERKRVLKYVLLLLPIISYYVILLLFSSPYPILDDFDAILNFLNHFTQSYDFIEKISLVFARHNEHRIVFDRIIAWIYLWIFGEINFKALILIGNISMLFVLYGLFLILKSTRLYNFKLLLAIDIFLFNFRGYEVSFWAMASLQNIWVLVFVLYSLYLLTKDGVIRFIASLFLAILAIFSSGNGMLLVPAGFCYFALRGNLFSIRSLFWHVILLGCVYLYFLDFSLNAGKKEYVDPSILHIIKFEFAFLGSLFPRFQTIQIMTGCIIAFVSVYAMVTFKRYSPLLLSILMFFLLTSCMVTYARHHFDIGAAASSRYAINCTLLYLVLYLLLKKTWFHSEQISLMMLIFACAYTIATYLIYIPVQIKELANPIKIPSLVLQKSEKNKQIIQASTSLGVYSISEK